MKVLQTQHQNEKVIGEKIPTVFTTAVLLNTTGNHHVDKKCQQYSSLISCMFYYHLIPGTNSRSTTVELPDIVKKTVQLKIPKKFSVFWDRIAQLGAGKRALLLQKSREIHCLTLYNYDLCSCSNPRNSTR